MPWPIERYGEVDFESAIEATRVAARIMDYVETPPGTAFLDGPLRAVIWLPNPVPPRPALFLSVGALEAAAVAGLNLAVSARRDSAALPANRALLLGDALDWQPASWSQLADERC